MVPTAASYARCRTKYSERGENVTYTTYYHTQDFLKKVVESKSLFMSIGHLIEKNIARHSVSLEDIGQVALIENARPQSKPQMRNGMFLLLYSFLLRNQNRLGFVNLSSL